MDKKLINIKEYIDRINGLLNYSQFKSLLENTKGVKNPINIIYQYTNDLEGLTKFINEDIYPNVRNTSIKQRCTRLLKCMNDPNQSHTPQSTPVNSDSDEQPNL